MTPHVDSKPVVSVYPLNPMRISSSLLLAQWSPTSSIRSFLCSKCAWVWDRSPPRSDGAAAGAKQARIGTMPSEQKRRIEDALEQLGEVEYKLRPHRKGAGPVRPKTLSPEESVHEKQGEIRQGAASRVHYLCSNEKCKEPIRKDKWDTHVSAQLMMTLRGDPYRFAAL